MVELVHRAQAVTRFSLPTLLMVVVTVVEQMLHQGQEQVVAVVVALVPTIQAVQPVIHHQLPHHKVPMVVLVAVVAVVVELLAVVAVVAEHQALQDLIGLMVQPGVQVVREHYLPLQA